MKEIHLVNGHKKYERLIKPIEDQMIKSVWRITCNSSDAEDAFQDALMKIWKHIKKIQRHPNPHALILRICANSAYDILKKNLNIEILKNLSKILQII